MIEIDSAFIFYQLTRIVITLAAQKPDRPKHQFSFECGQKLIHGLLRSHFDRFLQPSVRAVDLTFRPPIEMVATMGLAPALPSPLLNSTINLA